MITGNQIKDNILLIKVKPANYVENGKTKLHKCFGVLSVHCSEYRREFATTVRRDSVWHRMLYSYTHMATVGVNGQRVKM